MILKRVVLLAVWCCVAEPVFAQTRHAQCDDGYALCMSGCINDQTAERCMQSCQGAQARCQKSGVFKMPAGFVLNEGVLEYIVGQKARAEAPAIMKRKSPH
jgi:hypothetical protein